MRTFTLFALVILGSSLVNGVPFPAPGRYNSEIITHNALFSPDSPSNAEYHPRIGVKQIREPGPGPDHAPSLYARPKIGPRNIWKKALNSFTAGGNAYSGSTGDVSGGSVGNGFVSERNKRTTDEMTLGGNAITGNSGSTDGGWVMNQSNDNMPTLMNLNSNNAGEGGGSMAGCAKGGHGNERGAGGNAYGGSSGSAMGGSVVNNGGIMNVDSNNAGPAGLSRAGCAMGGSVTDEVKSASAGAASAPSAASAATKTT